MAKRKTMKQWSVPMKVVLRGKALVNAMTEEEAKEKAEEFQCEFDRNAEMTDWEVTGNPVENYP